MNGLRLRENVRLNLVQEWLRANPGHSAQRIVREVCEQHGLNAREEARRKAITLHPLAHYQERLANYLSPGQSSSMSAPDMTVSPLCPNNISDRKE